MTEYPLSNAGFEQYRRDLDTAEALKKRVVTALRSADPSEARMLNQGALEEVLWSEDEWQDGYADNLAAALADLVAQGTVQKTEAMGVDVFFLSRDAR